MVVMYGSDEIAIQINNILDDLDINENIDVFNAQIVEDEDDYASKPINLLQPLVKKYLVAKDMDGIDDDTRLEVVTRMNAISVFIIRAISSKFNFTVDDEWMEMNVANLPAFATALYNYFVIDFFDNNLTIMVNYIRRHKDELVKIHESDKPSNDVSSSANNKVLSLADAVIINNIYSVNDYIWSILDQDTVFLYTDKGYAPSAILQEMFSNFNLVGDFVVIVRSLHRKNLAFRSKAAFEIVYQIRETGNI